MVQEAEGARIASASQAFTSIASEGFVTSAELLERLDQDPITKRPKPNAANLEFTFLHADDLAGRLPAAHEMLKIQLLKSWLQRELGITTTQTLIRKVLQRIARDSSRSPIHP